MYKFYRKGMENPTNFLNSFKVFWKTISNIVFLSHTRLCCVQCCRIPRKSKLSSEQPWSKYYNQVRECPAEQGKWLWSKHRNIHRTRGRSVFLRLVFSSKVGGTVYLAAVIENADHAHTCIGNQQSSYISASGHLLYELKEGNKVWLRTYHVPATFIHSGYYSYFSGSKINSL